MKRLFVFVMLILALGCFQNIFAQSPQGKDLGFGIMLGDPTGVTVKYWTPYDNAFVFDLGTSYFGSPRFDVDYLWHFDAFNSDVAKLYAGPGVALGFGDGHSLYYNEGNGLFANSSGVGLGVRGVFGLNVIPRDKPLEFFFEVGVLVGFTPDFGSAVDAAIGMRFYP